MLERISESIGMPAVNPERLKKQVDDLLDLLEDPTTFLRQCLDLLDFYSDRTRRPTKASSADTMYWDFNAPRPVMRVLINGVVSRAKEQPAALMPIATVLWDAGFRETRLLACTILGCQRRSEVAQWIEKWISDCVDGAAIAELASLGLTGWRKADFKSFIAKMEVWLNGSLQRLRLFTLRALQTAVEDADFDDLPTIFRILSGASKSVRGESRQALYTLVRTLAKRSPPEATRFLLDELAGEVPGSRRMIRSLLENFPIRQRDLLERALSA